MSRMRTGELDGGDDEVVERRRAGEAAHGAERVLADVGDDVAARDVRVLARNGVADLRDGNLIGREAVGVHPDADGALEAAVDFHLADTQCAFELDLDDFVRQLSQLAL